MRVTRALSLMAVAMGTCTVVMAGPAGNTAVTPHGSDAWAAFAECTHQGVRVLTLGEKRRLLVPTEARHQRIDARALVEAVARFHGLKAAWSEDGAVAVIHAGAADEVVERIRRGLQADEADTRAEAAWLAGSTQDVRVLPLLIRSADDRDTDVARQAVMSLSRLGWPAALALGRGEGKAAWRIVARDPSRLLDAVQALGRTGHGGTFDVVTRAMKDPVAYARLNVALTLGDRGGEKAQANVERVLARGVRLEAISVLGTLGGERAVALLEKGLTDTDKDIRRAAAGALGEAGGNEAVPLLRKAMQDEEHAVRIAAAGALGHVGSDAAVTLLAEALGDEDRYVRYAAVRALGAIGGSQALAVLRDKALTDEQKSVRLKALVSLGQAGGADALPLLKEPLEDEDKYVRYAAVRALAAVPADRALPLLEKASKDAEAHVRLGAVGVLGGIGGEEAVELLGRARADDSEEVRHAALFAVGQVGGDKALALLAESLRSDEAAIRGKAAEALGSVGGSRALSLLAPAVSDADMSVRYSAVQALEPFVGQDVGIVLEKALADEEKAVRRQAVVVAGRVGGDRAIARLERALRDEAESVRREAVKALAALGGAPAPAALGEVLGDASKALRLEAITALGQVGGGKAMNRLATLMTDKDVQTRNAAIAALGNVRSTRALPLLEPALKDRFTVRSVVVALATIGGEGILPLLGRPEVVDGYPGLAACDAAITVRCMGGPKAVPLLKKFLYAANSPDARKVAIRGLADVGDKGATEILLKALDDKGTPLPELAGALARIGGERVWPGLSRLSTHTDRNVRRAVARGLSRPGLDRRKAEAMVLKLLDDKEPVVQADAARSLGRLGGTTVRDILIARLAMKISGHLKIALRETLRTAFPEDEKARRAVEGK